MLRLAQRSAQLASRHTRLASPSLRFNSSASAAASASAPASAVTEIVDLNDFSQVLASKKAVSVVDFYATWCGPCKAIAPIFDALAEKIPEAQFARVDVDRAEDVAKENAITAMPTILFFQKGEKVSTVVGANVPQLIKNIEQFTGVDVKLRKG